MKSECSTEAPPVQFEGPSGKVLVLLASTRRSEKRRIWEVVVMGTEVRVLANYTRAFPDDMKPNRSFATTE